MPFSFLDPVLAGALLAVVVAAGVLTAVDAVMNARTPQGATAWVFALLAVPLLSVPLYWVLGRFKFDDYLSALRRFDSEIANGMGQATHGAVAPYLVEPRGDGRQRTEMQAFNEMATLPFTRGNALGLLVDGDETFEALLAAIEGAERYVLTQFYIVRDDDIGMRYHAALVAAVERGVTVRFLYDGIGCWRLPASYRESLRAAGVEVHAFTGPRNWLKRLRINFRNHRKITVVDGREAFVGGLNVGDEYLGHTDEYPHWRDTHLQAEGPVVQGLQLSFARDWYYTTREELDDLEWEPTPAEADATALVLASGPADELETCGLLYAHTIESAEERVWIATPYFIPDGRVLGALQLAALRGVDVRVLMPRTTDSALFKYVPYAFLPEVERAGVQVFLYEPGFMHQKVALVDDDFAAVGTANFDNRSFRLNFEATVVGHDASFCADVGAMLEADFARATRITGADLEAKSFAFRFAANATQLLAPVL